MGPNFKDLMKSFYLSFQVKFGLSKIWLYSNKFNSKLEIIQLKSKIQIASNRMDLTRINFWKSFN